MSYLSIGENLNVDKTPSGFDPMKVYHNQLQELIRRLGYFTISGQKFPRLSYDEGLTLINFWLAMGDEMYFKLIEHNLIKTGPITVPRPYVAPSGKIKYFSGAISSDTQKWSEDIRHETRQFSQYMAVWTTNWLVKGTVSGEPTARLPADANRQLFNGPMGYASGIGQYAAGLKALVWGNFNIELPHIWGAIAFAAKESGKALTKGFTEAMDAASTAWTLTKLALYGTIAMAGLWAISMLAKKGRENVKGTK